MCTRRQSSTGTMICVLTALVAGCGGGGSSSTSSTISVSLSQTSATVQVRATASFSATVTNDSANMGVAWIVSCPHSPCGAVSPTVTASGAATLYPPPDLAPRDLKVTLKASTLADHSKAAVATLAVPGFAV